MKKTLPYVFITMLVTLGIITSFNNISPQPKHIVLFGDGMQENSGEAEARYRWELMRLADPGTGKMPRNMRQMELEFASHLPKLDNNFISSTTRTSSSGTFMARGPWNVGGRTRAIAIDVTNENIIFTGSVNGGLWRSTDGGASWTRVSPIGQNPAITSIAQDTRPGHTNTWYYSTGEPYGTSASATGAFYLGNGIYKSTDGGLTWTVLSATATNTPHTFESVWDLIWRIKTDPSDTVNDVIYAATYGTIRRSMNGGTTWTLERGATTNPYPYFTDVEVSPTGIVYSSLSSDGTGKGVWRKAGGVWTDISPAAWSGATINRMVIAMNPQNENSLYFLAETPNSGKLTTNFRGDIEWNSLWHYTYISGTGAGAGGMWEDLSANIPYPHLELGNFNSQGGYDLIAAVHPGDTNIVFLGGTNLYRSTTGFRDSTHTEHVGGYDPTSSIPFYVNYINHHSDEHAIAFFPSNPDMMIESSDGGIYKTLDNRAQPLAWLELNTGYLTSQFYTIAIDHGTVPNDIILGGTQDNGTWFTNNTNLTTPWTEPGWGDGSYCAIDDGHNNYYTSRQEGKTARMRCDANGNVTAFRRIDPIGAGDYLFINPFVLDPNDSNIMYMASGGAVWRNDSLTYIPLTGAWDTISTGWFRLPDSVQTAGVNVTAFGISRTPANRLYYGTSRKFLYRVDNANTTTPVTTDITSALFSAGTNISCVAVDPANADNIMVTFSNYAPNSVNPCYSIFYSSDGGTTFAKAAGNLEQNSAGSGAGPSVRWASIIPTFNGYVYLVGTSVGLYGTNHLTGFNTVWTQLSPNEIGYMVVDMMDFRTSDGYVAIGTHGAGVFSTYINDTLFTSAAEVLPFGMSANVFPNPSTKNISVDFTLIKSENISIKLFDIAGNVVDVLLNEFTAAGQHRITYENKSHAAGIYFLKIESEAGREVRKVVFME